MTEDQLKQLKQRIRECLKTGNERFKAKSKINTIKVIKSAKNYLGKAGWNKRDGWFVYFSEIGLKTDFDFVLKEIVPHEVAHIISNWLYINDMPNGDDGHGEGWRTIAKSLGSSGNQYARHPTMKLSGFTYRTSGGNLVTLNPDQHEQLQKQFKVFRDSQGNTITASGYIKNKSTA